MSRLSRRDVRLLVGGGVAVVLLVAGSTVALAAAGMGPAGKSVVTAAGVCTVPSLPGTVVQVTLSDVGGSMMGRRMAGGGVMGRRTWTSVPSGMARITLAPTSVTAGTVSLVVANAGGTTHEVVVLPLASGQTVGQRAVGSDGKVDEAGSAGEASASCAAGAGDGITAGSVGWVTLTLPAGRYELGCNLPGHYAAGMYAELDVG